MRVFHSLEEARGAFGPSVLTIGNFDGVHCGHESLFQEVKRKAKLLGAKASVLTFDPHPTKVVAPERSPKLLSTIAQRLVWMDACGLDQALVLPFTPQIAALQPEEFVGQILVEALEVKAVLVGDNFRFGNRQAGDTALLGKIGLQRGFTSESVEAVRWRGQVISSSAIRKCILEGDVSRAARMLGRFYSLEGNVVKGHGIGSKQTVPTLNLSTQAEILPACGVYVSRTFDLDSKRDWASITNVGYRPTFGGDELTIETFLLEPLGEPSPERIRVELTHRVREERRFESPEALKQQIFRDAAKAQSWHRRMKRFGLRTSDRTRPRLY